MNDDLRTLKTTYLTLGLNPRGLVFDSLIVHPKGTSNSTEQETRDVLVGFEDMESHRDSRPFTGPVVGRYANRLPAGKTELESGAVISLTGANSVCLHGGESGFDTLPWTPIERPDSTLFPLDDPEHPLPPPLSHPQETPSEASQLFRLYSPAGADGFPCTLETEALVVVEEPKEVNQSQGKGKSVGVVKVVLRSKIKEDGDKDIEKGTPVNLTVHWGFRLDDCLQNSHILSHQLYLDSTHLVSLDSKGLSTGSIDRIEPSKEFDFNSQGLEGKHREIGDGYPLEGGIDRCFLFESNPPKPQDRPTPLPCQPQVVLTSPQADQEGQGTRLSLSFKSSLPSVQIYTGPGLDGNGPRKKKSHSRGGQERGRGGYERDGAIFLEFQQPVGLISHTQATTREKGNELEKWMEERNERLGLGEKGLGGGERSWERDSLLRRGQVWEGWTEVDVRVL